MTSTTRTPLQVRKQWAERICVLMDESDIDLDSLRRQLRCGRSTVYSWRSGTRIPSPGAQRKLARAFGISLAELNGWAS